MVNLLDNIKNTTLLGAGPSSVAPSTYQAMNQKTLGHLDPYMIKINDGIMAGLREIMGTKNRLTIPLSGTGSIGMEASFVNTVEPGDKVLVLENGFFATRMIEVATRLGADVTALRFPWGKPMDLAKVKEQLGKDSYKIVAAVYAETSTGIKNPVGEIGALLKGSDALFIVDAVTALGGVPVEVDAWNIDILYSCTQKCLACPPGLSPFTFSDRAIKVMQARKTKVPNWYLDMGLLLGYYEGDKRSYHHTVPANMFYALYQGVLNILEEGKENVYKRHQAAHEVLVKGLTEIGWDFLVEDPKDRLPQLNTVVVPAGVDEAKLRSRLLNEYNIEISGGLGELAGKTVRIGLMGYNAQPHVVERLLAAMKEILK
ncbi:alanine--glyoxylate aminotransferase family protein [Oscillospiraceae bacterium OttesenSCG-928-G22]|nr:alanine--glyoxylate aminotransferase family protein [Oscillospiraceae bacterium OttesenSCG-928-G22]